ncbi:unnamed protein product [Medioppia subpectinata]|uniref:Uncharacterized protein n=1 Tax=Medioppia subpectinata TaxID=1979941 RepID=A0A7R9KEK0_9ACAR|nr:unnamed protein product [Medioppia subpectinata]CAG2101871.1 unnamed protein product [Medioppia subpectinata]
MCHACNLYSWARRAVLQSTYDSEHTDQEFGIKSDENIIHVLNTFSTMDLSESAIEMPVQSMCLCCPLNKLVDKKPAIWHHKLYVQLPSSPLRAHFLCHSLPFPLPFHTSNVIARKNCVFVFRKQKLSQFHSNYTREIAIHLPSGYVVNRQQLKRSQSLRSRPKKLPIISVSCQLCKQTILDKGSLCRARVVYKT